MLTTIAELAKLMKIANRFLKSYCYELTTFQHFLSQFIDGYLCIKMAKIRLLCIKSGLMSFFNGKIHVLECPECRFINKTVEKCVRILG